MNEKLPCEIVQDLLPSYVDGLTSDCSAKAVEAHLQGCSACSALYENMKKEYQQPAKREPKQTARSEQEKRLFHKIQHRLNRRVRRAVGAGIAAVLLVAVVSYGLFSWPVKEIGAEDVTMTATVYALKDYAEQADGVMVSLQTGDDAAVVIRKGQDDNSPQYEITLPDRNMHTMTVSGDVLAENGYVTVIETSSPYFLRDMDWSFAEKDGKRILYVSAFRTTILNNRAQDWNSTAATLDFSKVDQIIYTGGGQEQLLWEG